MAGSYWNDSTSHNTTTPLNKSVQAGSSKRHILLPRTFAGANVTCQVNGTQLELPTIPTPLGAWTLPPRTLSAPVMDSTLLGDYQARYIAFGNPPLQNVPTPWIFSIPTSTVISHKPLANATLQADLFFVVLTQTDSEAVNMISYFNTEAVISTGGTATRWTNSQSEYR